MSNILDPHEIDLAELFPSLPADRREEMRDLLDQYCEVAYPAAEKRAFSILFRHAFRKWHEERVSDVHRSIRRRKTFLRE